MSSNGEPAADQEPGMDCAEARRRIAAFVHASPAAAEARALRGHLVSCRDCAVMYRETLSAAARLGGAVRKERVERERERRHANLVRLSRGAAGTPSRSWLKFFLMTAALIFLFTRLGAIGFGASLRAEDAVGRVEIAGTTLGSDQTLTLSRGARCLTGKDATVALVGGSNRILLAAETGVIVEEAETEEGPRLRLIAGEIEVEGSCVITTEFGVATLVDGRGTLSLEAGLVARCEAGELAVIGPLGARALGAGERAAFGLDG